MLFLWLQCNTQKLLEIRFAVDSKCCGFCSEVFCRLRLQVCSMSNLWAEIGFSLRLCALGSGNDKNTFPSSFVGSGSSQINLAPDGSCSAIILWGNFPEVGNQTWLFMFHWATILYTVSARGRSHYIENINVTVLYVFITIINATADLELKHIGISVLIF